MAERKSGRKRKKEEGEVLNPSKDETTVAKHLRFNLTTKKASMFGDQVFYFSGAAAVDFLLDSKWAKSTKYPVKFTHRESVVHFLQKMLDCGLFNRVHLIKTEKKVKDKKKDVTEKKKEEKSKSKDPAEKKETDSPQPAKSKDQKSKEEKTPGSPKPKKDKDGKEVKRVKKKVKISLELHEFQDFIDAEDEYYVWIFDPISWKTFILGVLLVLGVVAICLFPLWPENIREYSWYLSVAGAIFVGAILILAILRYIIYGILWACTMGKLHFWLLPNLTAECGFFESFVPAYEYTVYKNEDKNECEEERRDSGTPSDDGGNNTDGGRDEKPPKEENIESQDKEIGKESNGWVKVKKGDVEEKVDSKKDA